jgi:hypothetical protein
VDGDAPLEVRQTKGRLAIPAICGTQNRKQCRVLRDGQKLAIAKGPTPWGKIATKHYDLTDVAFHRYVFLSEVKGSMR